MEVTYNSEAEYEANGWVCTDPDTNQYCKKIEEGVYHFREDRLVHPDNYFETRPYDAEMRLSDYDRGEIDSACVTFGYSCSDVDEWLEDEDGICLILECLFELE